MAEFKEYVQDVLKNQGAEVDDKIEKQLQPLSLQGMHASSDRKTHAYT